MTVHQGKMAVPLAFVEFCPRCKKWMNLKTTMPTMFVVGSEEVTFECADCGAEIKKTIDRGRAGL
jgi:ribosomal protein L44E